MKYQIGTQFIPVGGHSVHIVVDYHETKNLAGDVVKGRYVTKHKFMGQDVITHDVLETTIARGINRKK